MGDCPDINTRQMTEPFSILSIEDDVDLFDLVDVTLSSLPVRLYHARTGADALKLIPKLHAHVLILDITLPDINGWDLLKQMSKLECNPQGIIVLTARTDPAHRVMAHFQDVTFFMTKPFRPAELRDAVRNILGLA